MFGERLRALRERRELTQSELGKVLRVSKQTISNYENGVSAPDQETLGRLADYFGVSTDYLLGRTDDPRVAGSDDPPSPAAACLSKLTPDLRSLIVHDVENGAMYLRILAEAVEHGVSARGLQQLLEALIAAKETADETPSPQPKSNK